MLRPNCISPCGYRLETLGGGHSNEDLKENLTRRLFAGTCAGPKQGQGEGVFTKPQERAIGRATHNHCQQWLGWKETMAINSRIPSHSSLQSPTGASYWPKPTRSQRVGEPIDEILIGQLPGKKKWIKRGKQRLSISPIHVKRRRSNNS